MYLKKRQVIRNSQQVNKNNYKITFVFKNKSDFIKKIFRLFLFSVVVVWF